LLGTETFASARVGEAPKCTLPEHGARVFHTRQISAESSASFGGRTLAVASRLEDA